MNHQSRGGQVQTYWDILRLCQASGHRVDSRAGAVRELLNVQMVIHPRSLPRRVKMRRELGYMEFLQFITGIYDKETIHRVAPNVNLSLFGKAAIYGPRVWGRMDQLLNAIHELHENPHSRRAVVMVHDSQDYLSHEPCISSFQFHLRYGILRTTINVRSWDLWFGAPHDLIMMSGVIQTVANSLNVQAGEITINAANAHIYEMSMGDVGGSTMYWDFSLPQFQNVFALPSDILSEYRRWAMEQINNESWLKGAPPGVKEDWPRIPPLSPLKDSGVSGGVRV